MDDVRGRFLGLPHGTTLTAVTTNKNIKIKTWYKYVGWGLQPIIVYSNDDWVDLDLFTARSNFETFL